MSIPSVESSGPRTGHSPLPPLEHCGRNRVGGSFPILHAVFVLMFEHIYCNNIDDSAAIQHLRLFVYGDWVYGPKP